MNITTHTIVKNEDRWIWHSLVSVKDYVSRMLIVDDSSTDKTVEIIKTINDPKIELSSITLTSPKDHTFMRNKMLEATKTDWFMLLDGDEIWNAKAIKDFLQHISKLEANIYGVVCHTRNCVGDVYHYLPESAGKYELLGRRGHLTIRAYRKLPAFHWQGEYPLESFCNAQGIAVNQLENNLSFFDGFYWHMTHLVRSSSREAVKGWRKTKLDKGIEIAGPQDLPEVFHQTTPPLVPSPWTKRSASYELAAKIIAPIKALKRHI